MLESANTRLIDELYEALEAQMKVSEQMMRHAKFSDQDILDCTAQARRVLALVRIDTLMEAEFGSLEGEELNTLTDLVVIYEEITEGKW